MKIRSKVKKGRLVLRILLMFCWSFCRHIALNKDVWENLGPTVKNNLSPYKNILLKGEDDCTGCNRGNVDQKLGSDKHRTVEECRINARAEFNKAEDYYINGDYRAAAYKIGYALHFIQDMSDPVHCAQLHGSTKQTKFSPYTDGQVHTNYEDWENWDAWGMQCHKNLSGCDALYAIYKAKIANREAHLQTLIEDANGSTAFTHTNVQNYIKGRVGNKTAGWFKYFIANDASNMRNLITYDLALSAAIQMRYIDHSACRWLLK